MAVLFAKYSSLLARRPLLTNVISTGVLFGTGDVLAQEIAPEKSHRYDWARTCRAMIYGAVCFAPIGDRWMRFLATIKAPVNRSMDPPKLAIYDTVTRVAVDQLGFAPLLAIPMYYSVMTVLEGQGDIGTVAAHKIERNWWPTLRANWTVWPAFQALNFSVVPVRFRLLLVNVFSIGWNCFLSMALHRPETSDPNKILPVDVSEKNRDGV